MTSDIAKLRSFVENVFDAVAMANQQPSMRVFRWRIYGDKANSLLVYEAPGSGKIMVSSSIEYWDTGTGKLLTDSGCVYELIGKQAENALDLVLALMRPVSGTSDC